MLNQPFFQVAVALPELPARPGFDLSGGQTGRGWYGSREPVCAQSGECPRTGPVSVGFLIR
jgi:hypothetical protein